MPGELRYDPEQYALIQAAYGEAPVPTAPPPNVMQFRPNADEMMRAIFRQEPTPENITRRVIDVESHDGAKIQVHRFADSGTTTDKPGPAVLYIHGGGFVSCNVEIYAPQIARWAARTGIPFFAVGYRLAPEQKGDGLVRNAYAALEHLSSHAAELGVDPARIAVMGDSAGAGIAAGTALLARDKGLQPPLAQQLLFYPMIDDRTSAPGPDAPKSKFLFIWDGARNDLAWKALLGEDKAGKEDADVSEYAVPARATDLSNLPDTYVDIGGLDLFADEAIEFVRRLAKANVQTEFHLFPGVLHGFDAAPTSAAKMAFEAREKFLRRL